MIVQCPGCDAPHESIYSAGQHAWKSQDSDHDDYDELDAALVAVMTHNDVVEDVDPVEDVDQEDTDDAGVDSPELSNGDTTDPPATTDGGRQAPPMPDLEDVDDQDDGDTNLPDRFVPVEDYVAAAGDALGDEQVAQLRDALDDYDVVDVEATTAENIVAHPLEEVAA